MEWRVLARPGPPSSVHRNLYYYRYYHCRLVVPNDVWIHREGPERHLVSAYAQCYPSLLLLQHSRQDIIVGLSWSIAWQWARESRTKYSRNNHKERNLFITEQIINVTNKMNLCGRLPGRKFPSSWPPMLIQMYIILYKHNQIKPIIVV